MRVAQPFARITDAMTPCMRLDLCQNLQLKITDRCKSLAPNSMQTVSRWRRLRERRRSGRRGRRRRRGRRTGEPSSVRPNGDRRRGRPFGRGYLWCSVGSNNGEAKVSKTGGNIVRWTFVIKLVLQFLVDPKYHLKTRPIQSAPRCSARTCCSS